MRLLAVVLLAMLLCRQAQAEPLHFVTEEFAPFNETQDGAVAGPGAEIARSICRVLVLDCSFEALPLRRAIATVEAGRADAVFSLAHTVERDATMRFTQPFIRSGYALFTRRDQNHEAANLRDFAGFTIAAYGPSGTYSNLEALQQTVPSLQLVQELTFEAPFRMLQQGRYPEPAAVFANWHVGLLWLKNHGVDGITVAFPDKPIDYCYGFSRRSAAAQRQFARFDTALGTMRRNGELLAILAKFDFAESDLPTDR
jgi:polar amino acid transport system substrate-binding protein